MDWRRAPNDVLGSAKVASQKTLGWLPLKNVNLVLTKCCSLHLGLDRSPLFHPLEVFIMHQSAHSRHRALGRRLPEPGVPLEAAGEESRALGLSNVDSCDNSGISGSNGASAKSSESRGDITSSSESPIIEFESGLGPKLAPLSDTSTVAVQPSLLAESDVECPLCCRLLFTPITTRCGMLQLLKACCEKRWAVPCLYSVANIHLLALPLKMFQIDHCGPNNTPYRSYLLQDMLHDGYGIFLKLSFVSAGFDFFREGCTSNSLNNYFY